MVERRLRPLTCDKTAGTAGVPGDGGPGDCRPDERIGRALTVAAYLLRERRDSGTVVGGEAV
jgi:hypothetical protein